MNGCSNTTFLYKKGKSYSNIENALTIIYNKGCIYCTYGLFKTGDSKHMFLFR